MSGILSRIKSALGKVHPKNFLAALVSTTSAKDNPDCNPPTPAPEETIPFTVRSEAQQTWYRICGDITSNSVPLVVVHGGMHDH